MPVMEQRPFIRPLCYEHHTLMPYAELGPGVGVFAAYVCPESGCPICYDDCLLGYFLKEDVDPAELKSLPTVNCPIDARLMYLLEVAPQRPSFRLWRCPKCFVCRVSGELP